MWIELALAVPSVGAAFCARKRIVKGLRYVPFVKRALPALPAPDPTTVLAEMVALKLIEQLPAFGYNEAQSFKLGEAELAFLARKTDNYNSYATPIFQGQLKDQSGWLRVDSLQLRGPKAAVTLRREEKNIICAALKQVYDLQADRRKLLAERDRQDTALVVISQIMGVETPEPDDTPVLESVGQAMPSHSTWKYRLKKEA